MRVDLFDFELPEDRIALRPVRPRDAARMLVVHPGSNLEDRRVADLPVRIGPNDVLFVNDTKVILAELSGERLREESRAGISVTVITRLGQDRWRVLGRPAKRRAAADRLRFGSLNESACLISGI